MAWVSVILALLSAANTVFDWLKRREILNEGEDRQIAKALAEQLRKTNYAKQALQEARLMSDAELAERLRDLEPRETDSK